MPFACKSPHQSQTRLRIGDSNGPRLAGWSLALLMGIGILGLLSGCGDANPLGRKAISGKVTLDGQPLERGSVTFVPLAEGGVGSGAVITDGTLSIPAAKGLPPGEYLVRIHAAGETSAPPPTGPPGAAPPPAIELVPANWNTQSEQTVTVTGDGENQFTFPIETTSG